MINILTFICQWRGWVKEMQNWQRATAVNICRHLRTFVAVCWHLLGPSSVSFRSGADSGAAAAEKRTSFFLTQSSQIRKIFGIFKWHLFWFPMTSNAISQKKCEKNIYNILICETIFQKSQQNYSIDLFSKCKKETFISWWVHPWPCGGGR